MAMMFDQKCIIVYELGEDFVIKVIVPELTEDQMKTISNNILKGYLFSGFSWNRRMVEGSDTKTEFELSYEFSGRKLAGKKKRRRWWTLWLMAT